MEKTAGNRMHLGEFVPVLIALRMIMAEIARSQETPQAVAVAIRRNCHAKMMPRFQGNSKK
jgi:hypothetical protein